MKRNKRLADNYNDFEFRLKKGNFLDDLDPDLQEYFDDLKLIKNKKGGRKKKANFNIGDQVEVNNAFGTIIYGPYLSENQKDTYEIEMEDGSIITAEDDGQKIKKYIPPVEEKEDDDLL